MINIYIDTNCYILYVQEKLPDFSKILELEKRGIMRIFNKPNLEAELLDNLSIPKEERGSLIKILKTLEYRESPFTVGVSRIGGNDYVSRFSNKKNSPDSLTIGELKKTVKRTIFPNKKSLSGSDIQDVEHYSEAINLGCQYFITQNVNDFGKEKSAKRKRIEKLDTRVNPICKIRTVEEFLLEV